MPTTDAPSIIAACDGADRGRQAVVLGRIIAEATGARLTIGAAAIAVGSRGRSAAREVMLGSAAMPVLHHTDRPVVVVPGRRSRPVD
jgi:hypothetical protein